MTTHKEKLQGTDSILLRIGARHKRPHYAVIGTPTKLYLWKQERGSEGTNTEWIVGQEAIGILNTLKSKSRTEFIACFQKFYAAHEKKPAQTAQTQSQPQESTHEDSSPQ